MAASRSLRADSYMELSEIIPKPLLPVYCVLLGLAQSARQVYRYHEFLPDYWRLVKSDMIRLKQIWASLNGGDLGRAFTNPRMLEASRARLLMQWAADSATRVPGYYINALRQTFQPYTGHSPRWESLVYKTLCGNAGQPGLGVRDISSDPLAGEFTGLEAFLFTVCGLETLGVVELRNYPRSNTWEVEVELKLQEELSACVVDALVAGLPSNMVTMSGSLWIGDATPSCTLSILAPWEGSTDDLPPAGTTLWCAHDSFLPALRRVLNAAGVPVTGIRRLPAVRAR